MKRKLGPFENYKEKNPLLMKLQLFTLFYCGTIHSTVYDRIGQYSSMIAINTARDACHGTKMESSNRDGLIIGRDGK